MCWSQNYDRDGNVVAGLKGALNEFKEITGNKKLCIATVHQMKKKLVYAKHRRF